MIFLENPGTFAWRNARVLAGNFPGWINDMRLRVTVPIGPLTCGYRESLQVTIPIEPLISG